jgi:hypothetical protein
VERAKTWRYSLFIRYRQDNAFAGFCKVNSRLPEIS